MITFYKNYALQISSQMLSLERKEDNASNMNRYDELLELLSKSVWTVNDIRIYDKDIRSRQTATNIKTKAMYQFDGKVPYGNKYVKVDSVLKLYGTTREKEIENLKKIKETEKNEI